MSELGEAKLKGNDEIFNELNDLVCYQNELQPGSNISVRSFGTSCSYTILDQSSHNSKTASLKKGHYLVQDEKNKVRVIDLQSLTFDLNRSLARNLTKDYMKINYESLCKSPSSTKASNQQYYEQVRNFYGQSIDDTITKRSRHQNLQKIKNFMNRKILDQKRQERNFAEDVKKLQYELETYRQHKEEMLKRSLEEQKNNELNRQTRLNQYYSNERRKTEKMLSLKKK